MLEIGVQTQNAVRDEDPSEGFGMLKEADFSCCDFSLNSYLLNTDLNQCRANGFFDRSLAELETFFTPHNKAAKEAGIRIHQMHMPYPILVPDAKPELNTYLRDHVAVKSMGLCHFFGCRYTVIHGLKVARYLGSDELEWQETEKFLDFLAPMAKEMGITLCVENLYNSRGHHIVEGPCCDAKKAMQRIDRFNERHRAEILGFCFDTGHANLVGIDMEDFIVTLGNRLKVLHIHDNDGVGDLHQIPFTFTRTRENSSTTDWEGFICGLRKIKFDGVLSFETAPVLRSFPEKLKKEVLHFIADIGKYFAGEIEKTEKEIEKSL